MEAIKAEDMLGDTQRCRQACRADTAHCDPVFALHLANPILLLLGCWAQCGICRGDRHAFQRRDALNGSVNQLAENFAVQAGVYTVVLLFGGRAYQEVAVHRFGKHDALGALVWYRQNDVGQVA
ncbi:hypothetical protein D3C81_1416010 [compost metagenome]